ncbi:hypothetical protein Tco_0541271 [Tanacetum coccineum]
MNLMPTVAKAYNMIRQEEKQREGFASKIPVSTTLSAHSNNYRNSYSNGFNNGGRNRRNYSGNYSQCESSTRNSVNNGNVTRRSVFKKGVICGNYGKEGHTKEECCGNTYNTIWKSSWASRMLMYIKGKPNGKLLVDYVLNGPFQYRTIVEPGTETTPATVRARTYTDLIDEEKLRESVDIMTTNIVLQGSELSLQEQESKLYDDFDTFTSMPGETIHSYYMQFAQLINDMHTIGMTMKPLQVNTKFVDHLQPEWSKFVTDVKLAKTCIPPTLITGLVVPTFNPSDDPIASLNKEMAFLSTIFASRFPQTNNQLRTSSNPMNQATIRGWKSYRSDTFQTDDLYAFDSNCDDVPSAKAVVMGNLSSYDSDVLSEESKQKEDKYLDEVIDLQKKNKALDNVVYKMGQSTQTMHMLTKPQVFYDESHKIALELAEESRLKMLAKQDDPSLKKHKVNLKPVDYVALNKLSEHFAKHFVPQTQLSAEQAYWLPISQPVVAKPPVPSEPVLKKEIPLELPSISLNRILGVDHIKWAFEKDVKPFAQTLKEYFHMFEHGLQKELKEMKVVFTLMKTEVEHGLQKELKEIKAVFTLMKTEVAKCSVDKKYFEIEKKELSLDNDRLLEHIIFQDVMNVVKHANDHHDNVLPANNNSLVYDNSALHRFVDEYEENLKLQTKLANKNDMIEKAVYNELSKRSQLEAKNVSIAKLKEHIANVKGKNIIENYLKHTQANADILREIVKELLVYVSATCPSTKHVSDKLVDATPMNRTRKVRCKGVTKQIVGVVPKGLALLVVLVDLHSKDESGKWFKLEVNYPV